MDAKRAAEIVNKLNDRVGFFRPLCKFVNKLAYLTIPFTWFENDTAVKPAKTTKLLHTRHLDLIDKYALYLKLCKENHADGSGFIMTDQCDSALFSGLMAGLEWGGIGTDPDDFWGVEHGFERALRRPREYPECCPNDSKSSFSRDMAVGVLWALSNRSVFSKNLALCWYEALKKNDFIMGVGDITRLYMTPGLQATLAEIARVGGGVANFVQTWPTNLTGYELHLNVLHILIRGRLKDGISRKMLKVLRLAADNHPHNALYQFAYAHYTEGNHNAAASILLMDHLFPEDRLPNENDRSEPWLWQRDYGEDWVPANVLGPKEHTGGDFLFVASLILGEL